MLNPGLACWLMYVWLSRQEVSCRTGVNCPKLTLCTLCSVATQHDTCPVCRKSLNGEDSSSEPPSQSPSLSMDPRPQERWSFWDTHLSHPSVLHAYILQHSEKMKKKRFSLSSVHLSCSHNHLSLILFLYFYFLFQCLSPQPCTQTPEQTS